MLKKFIIIVITFYQCLSYVRIGDAILQFVTSFICLVIIFVFSIPNKNSNFADNTKLL